MNFKYRKVVLGGTFDLLHLGHKALLLKAFELGREVIIGITTDKFSKNTFWDQNLRLKNLKFFLEGKNYKTIWLNDIFGTTLNDADIETIVVSPETKISAEVINQERVKRGLRKLDIVVIPFVRDETGKIISSTRIRKGEINLEGMSFKKLLLKIAGKKLSEKVKNELKKPFGDIVYINRSQIKSGMTITVGDITTKKFLEAGIIPKLSIVDFRVKRQTVFKNLSDLGFHKSEDIKVKSEAGQISKSLISAVEKALAKNSQLILVEGEEDLAAIPAILLSSLGMEVFYGQPDQGAIMVKVTPEIKKRICNILF